MREFRPKIIDHIKLRAEGRGKCLSGRLCKILYKRLHARTLRKPILRTFPEDRLQPSTEALPRHPSLQPESGRVNPVVSGMLGRRWTHGNSMDTTAAMPLNRCAFVCICPCMHVHLYACRHAHILAWLYAYVYLYTWAA